MRLFLLLAFASLVWSKAIPQDDEGQIVILTPELVKEQENTLSQQQSQETPAATSAAEVEEAELSRQEESRNFIWKPTLTNDEEENALSQQEQQESRAQSSIGYSKLNPDELEDSYEILKVRQSQPARSASRTLRQELAKQDEQVIDDDIIDDYYIPKQSTESKADQKEEIKSDDSNMKPLESIKKLTFSRKSSKSDEIEPVTVDDNDVFNNIDPDELEEAYEALKWQFEPARALGSKRRQEIIQNSRLDETSDDYYVPVVKKQTREEKSKSENSGGGQLVNLAMRRKLQTGIVNEEQGQQSQMFSELDPDEIEAAYENLKRDAKPARKFNWDQGRQTIEEEENNNEQDEQMDDRYQQAPILNEEHDVEEIEQAYVELKKAKAIKRPSLLSKLQDQSEESEVVVDTKEEKSQDAAAAAAAAQEVTDKKAELKEQDQSEKISPVNEQESNIRSEVVNEEEIEDAILEKEIKEIVKEAEKEEKNEKLQTAEEGRRETAVEMDDEDDQLDAPRYYDTDADWNDYDDENWEKVAEKEEKEQKIQ